MSLNDATKKYSLAEIRAAFWAAFHENGEVWFDYLSNETDNNKSTEANFESLVDELRKVRP